MSEIHRLYCDGPDCTVCVDANDSIYAQNPLMPLLPPHAWYKLRREDKSLAFHNFDCLVNWLEQHQPQESPHWPFRKKKALA